MSDVFIMALGNDGTVAEAITVTVMISGSLKVTHLTADEASQKILIGEYPRADAIESLRELEALTVPVIVEYRPAPVRDFDRAPRRIDAPALRFSIPQARRPDRANRADRRQNKRKRYVQSLRPRAPARKPRQQRSRGVRLHPMIRMLRREARKESWS